MNMNPDETRLTQWAINTIETKYRDDVSILIEHNSLRLDKDSESKSFSYYIPASNRANGLAKTFIINGIGYDLFPMSWERIERMADIKEYNTTCLADAEILWARTEGDRQRFLSLQARLQANLQNPQYMLVRAKKWLETVKEIYQDTLFEEKVYKVRENAGYICDLLSIAVAFANQQYLPHGQTDQLQALSVMNVVPKDFVRLYREIIVEASPDSQKRLCYNLIKNTMAFLDAQEDNSEASGTPDYSELASWYQELCYTWRRVYHWCDKCDPVNAYLWCCMLQNEAEEWGLKFRIADIDILSSFDKNDLAGFRKRAETVEQHFRDTINENGVVLDEYKTVEDFIKAN